jgi:hypothetical protein
MLSALVRFALSQRLLVFILTRPGRTRISRVSGTALDAYPKFRQRGANHRESRRMPTQEVESR